MVAADTTVVFDEVVGGDLLDLEGTAGALTISTNDGELVAWARTFNDPTAKAFITRIKYHGLSRRNGSLGFLEMYRHGLGVDF